MRHISWFSCGAASAVAAKKTVELYGKDHEVRIINNPVKEEHHDNMRFLKDVESWIGLKIEFAVCCIVVSVIKKYTPNAHD